MGVATFRLTLSRRPKADGTAAVLLRVTKDRKNVEVQTGVFVPPSHFNERGTTDRPTWIRDRNHENGLLNAELLKRMQAARALHLARPDLSAAELAARLRAGHGATDAADFFTLAGAEISRLHEVSTANLYTVAVERLRAWHGADSLAVPDLTRARVREFEAWLFRQPRIKSANTVTAYLRKIAALWRLLFDGGHVPPATPDPFYRYRYPSQDTDRIKLTRDDVARLAALDLAPGTAAWLARAAFLLQFYTHGARISDALQLRWPEGSGDRARFRSDKTAAIHDVPISAPLAELLATCRALVGADARSFVLPYLPAEFDALSADRQHAEVHNAMRRVNRWLVKLQAAAGIGGRLTSHVARHTLANLADRATGDIRVVQKMLGHKRISTTEKYLASLRTDETDRASAAVYGPNNLQTKPPAQSSD